MTHNLANSTGYIYTTENIGELSNKGFEMTITATPISNRDFNSNVSANLGLDRNKVKKALRRRGTHTLRLAHRQHIHRALPEQHLHPHVRRHCQRMEPQPMGRS